MTRVKHRDRDRVPWMDVPEWPTAVENPAEVFKDIDGNLDQQIESLGDLTDQLRENLPQLYELDWFLIE